MNIKGVIKIHFKIMSNSSETLFYLIKSFTFEFLILFIFKYSKQPKPSKKPTTNTPTPPARKNLQLLEAENNLMLLAREWV